MSGDGADWKALKPMDMTWAEGSIKVGLVGLSDSSGPHEVKFDDYLLKAR